MSVTCGVFVAVVTQHAMSMRLDVLPSLASAAVPHFSTLSHKRHDFRKNKKLLKLKYVFLIFATTCV
jgi:hypothetical protein